jgi:hypothetical protein
MRYSAENKMKALLALLLTITLGGCATTPENEEEVSTFDTIIDTVGILFSIGCLFDNEVCDEPEKDDGSAEI